MDGDYIIDVPEEGKDTTRLSPSGELTAQTTLRQSNASVASIPEFYGSYNTVGFEASFEKDVRKRAEHGVHRIYFSPKENTSDNAVTYSGGLAVQGPINVYASKRYVELPINDEIEKGIYNVRVALKLDHLDIDSIEAIAFYQRYEALEVFTKDDLKLSDTFKSKILVLELHNQLFVEYKSNPGYFIMELRTSTHTLAERDPGYAELHYMWLHTPLPSAMHDGVYGMDGIDGMEGMEDLNDAIVRAHQPFLWSVNVGIKDDTTGPHAPSVPARIISYSASGDGSHVATLSTKDEMLQLDIWDLEIPPHSTLDMDNFNERRAPFLPKPYEPYRIPLKDAKAYSCKQEMHLLKALSFSKSD
ncbi:hypothetical protein BGX34_010701 [Mortierella sp. NVP85]|nr:hypothetical protein BGX34_010701 [Mortierella sp. NVP85]